MSEKIGIAYLEKDVPWLLIFCERGTSLAPIIGAFRLLAKQGQDLFLESQPNCVSYAGASLKCLCAGGMLGFKRHPRFQGLKMQGQGLFVWRRSAEGWDYLAAMLESLENSNEGHLYLTRFPDEDAVVIVSKGEYSQESIRASVEGPAA